MDCNLNIEILFKYYPCTYNTILLKEPKIWYGMCQPEESHPSVKFFVFKNHKTIIMRTLEIIYLKLFKTRSIALGRFIYIQVIIF